MKPLKIIVLAKQVPDTRNVGKNAMKADGTINRASLPAIFNPEDLNALEQALRIKDKRKDTIVNILTMGPPRAAEIIREALYIGADGGYLITDRAFAGSDTLATSYTIAQTLKKIKEFDIIFAGRQAIDGDTAQVGPQVAEKLGIPQVTYAEEILNFDEKKITIKRRVEGGIEILEAPLPILITVNGSAPKCRYKNAKYIMKYKHAKMVSETQAADEDYLQLQNNRPYLNIKEWNTSNIEVEKQYLGLGGSPTKVYKVKNVVFQAKETKVLSADSRDIESLMKELINNHTIE